MRLRLAWVALVYVVCLTGCSSTTPSATSSPTTKSSAVTSAAGSPLAVPAVADKLIAALNQKSNAALADTAKRSIANPYIKSTLLIAQTRGDTPNFIKTTDGYQDGSLVWQNFQVDPSGLLTTWTRNGVPLEKKIAAGNGTIHRSADGKVTWSIVCFRDFDVSADGNLSLVYEFSNSSDKDASVSVESYTANGKTTPEAAATSITAGTKDGGLPVALGNVPSGAHLTLQLSTEPSKNIDVVVPQLG